MPESDGRELHILADHREERKRDTLMRMFEIQVGIDRDLAMVGETILRAGDPESRFAIESLGRRLADMRSLLLRGFDISDKEWRAFFDNHGPNTP